MFCVIKHIGNNATVRERRSSLAIARVKVGENRCAVTTSVTSLVGAHSEVC